MEQTWPEPLSHGSGAAVMRRRQLRVRRGLREYMPFVMHGQELGRNRSWYTQHNELDKSNFGQKRIKSTSQTPKHVDDEGWSNNYCRAQSYW